MYHQLLVSKPKNDMKAQLKELASSDMHKSLFPNLGKICSYVGEIYLSISVMTASVERSFSQMKLIKTCLSSLNDKNL